MESPSIWGFPFLREEVMAHELDTIINRYGTDCLKWDYMEKWLGVPEGEALPSWVSDWDFKAPNFITDALQERLNHGIFGYSERGDEYFNSIIDWWAERHQVSLQKEWFHTTPGSLPAIAMLVEQWCQVGDKVLVLSEYISIVEESKIEESHVLHNDFNDENVALYFLFIRFCF